jgi:hypothetical protein
MPTGCRQNATQTAASATGSGAYTTAPLRLHGGELAFGDRGL